jgi:hypothetical protein
MIPQRLIVTRALPELLDRFDDLLCPPLPAGTEVWAYDGPTDIPTAYGNRPGLPDDYRAVTLADDPRAGWWPVPADAVEEC